MNGINKNIGWHTFRHTFGTLLKANGEDVKTVQDLLRHANSRITLEVYTQGCHLAQARSTKQGCTDDGFQSGSEGQQKRPANCGVVSLLDLYWTRVWVVTVGAI